MTIYDNNEEGIHEMDTITGFDEEDFQQIRKAYLASIAKSDEIIKCDNQLEIDAIMELYTRAMKLAKEAASFNNSELWIEVAKEKAAEIKSLRNTTEE